MRKSMSGALFLALAIAGCGSTGNDAAARTASASTVSLTISAAGQKHAFRVEVARSEVQQERGLMFRSHLAPDAGMIFPMDPPRVASFWMKNTIIPLDMIFIRPDGSIARIAAQTVPYSLAPVSSGEPVAAVLEIAGGRAAELGIDEDDKVVWTDKP
jgi:hypothetical protein